jgi:DNA-binding CsgD family transcriptional regulator
MAGEFPSSEQTPRTCGPGVEWHRPLIESYAVAIAGDDPMFGLMAHALDYVTGGAPAFIAAYALIDVSDEDRRIGPCVVKVDGKDAPSPHDVYELYMAASGLDPFNAAAVLDPARTVVTDEDVGGPERVRDSRFARAYLDRVGAGPSARILLADEDGRLSATITLRRRAEESGFAAGERQFLSASHQFIEAVHSIAVRKARADGNLPAVARAYGLSSRQQQIVQLVLAGAGNAQIAEQLVVAPGTVTRHLNRIYAKLGVTTRTQLVAMLTHPPG